MGWSFSRTLVGLVFAVVLSLVWSDSARAVVIADFTFTADDLSVSGSGSFSIDDDLFTGSGVEVFVPAGGGARPVALRLRRAGQALGRADIGP